MRGEVSSIQNEGKGDEGGGKEDDDPGHDSQRAAQGTALGHEIGRQRLRSTSLYRNRRSWTSETSMISEEQHPSDRGHAEPDRYWLNPCSYM